MASNLNYPFDLERCGPAVDMALEEVNEKFLAQHRIKLLKVQKRWAKLSDLQLFATLYRDIFMCLTPIIVDP